MSLKDETADALYAEIKAQTVDKPSTQGLRLLAESFALVAGTRAGNRRPSTVDGEEDPRAAFFNT